MDAGAGSDADSDALQPYALFEDDEALESGDAVEVVGSGAGALPVVYHASRAFVWPSAKLLAELVVAGTGRYAEWIQNRRVLELGCGMGLPSLAAADAGAARVVATDVDPGCLRRLRFIATECPANREQWGPARAARIAAAIRAEPLDWFFALSGEAVDPVPAADAADVCLCADVNYHPDARTALALARTVWRSRADRVLLVSREHRAGFLAFAGALRRLFATCVADREPMECERREIGVAEEERHSLFAFQGRREGVCWEEEERHIEAALGGA